MSTEVPEFHVSDVKKGLDHISATIPRGYWTPTPTMVNAWYFVIQNDMRRKKRTPADFAAAIGRWCATQKEPPGSPAALNEMMDVIAREKREREDHEEFRRAQPRARSSISKAVARTVIDAIDGKIPKSDLKDDVTLKTRVMERMDEEK